MQKVICEILGIGCRFLLSKNLCFRYSLFPLARFQITDGRGELGVRSGCHRPAVGSIYDFLCRNLTWLFADANQFSQRMRKNASVGKGEAGPCVSLTCPAEIVDSND